jgi:hypothetical protein
MLLLAAAAAWSAPARAENAVRSGDLVLHYSAIPTTTLTAEIARQAQVTRSANRALVNVAIRRGSRGADTAVAAKVTIAATNLSGQRSQLRVREVREGDAIYYLAEARFAGNETLAFDVEAAPDGAPPIKVSFRQEFFPQ